MPIRVSASWNAYPAVVLASAVAAGILLESRYGLGVCGWLGGLAAAATLGGALFLIQRVGRRLIEATGLLLTVAGLAAAASVGGLRYATFYVVPANHALLGARAPDGMVEWAGRVTEPPVYSTGSVRFSVRLSGGGPPVGLIVTGRPPAGAPIELCDEVSLRGRIEPLPRPRNPGDFDYGRYLVRRRTYARLHLADGGVSRIGHDRTGPVCGTERTRRIIRSRLEHYVRNESSRAVLHALILGDRRALDADVRDQFARMGLLHLLAVSGLHVMVVGMIFYRLLGPTLNRFGLRWRAADGIRTASTTALLLGYMLLTGCSASVVRAVVMAVLFLFSTTLQRPARSVNTLGVAIAVLLLAQPAHLFEAGFQLSVTAVGAILLLVPQLSTWIPPPGFRLGRHIHATLSVTAAATIGTLPVVLSHFGQVGLAGLVLNLPSIPLTTAALAAGVVAVGLGGPAEPIGEILGASADLLAGVLLQVAAYGDSFMRWSVVRWRIDEPLLIAAIFFTTAGLAVWHVPRIRWRCLLLSLTVVAIYVGGSALQGRYRPHLDVIFLDVGQGDAVILRLPNGDGVLIDAGTRTPFSDAGSRVVVPQLVHHGIRRLSSVVITHPDSDHLGGLPAVLRSVPVNRVIRSGVVGNSRLYDETNHLLDSLGLPVQTARTGDTLMFAPMVRGYVLHPPETNSKADANAHSIVLLVRFGGVSILFTGDAPAEAELAIVRRYGDMVESDLLKVGHHGSRTSSTSAILNRVARRVDSGSTSQRSSSYAVVSVAASNRYGLPNEDVLARLNRSGFRLSMTSTDGAVWFRTDGRRLERVAWRPR